MRRWWALGLWLTAALVGSACSIGSPTGKAGGRLQVVAAENVWGSLAAQLGGDRVRVRSIIASPATDPHDYEPTAGDSRAVATARYVIFNGIGYDPWAPKLVAANSSGGRLQLNVGQLLGIKAGGNPHRWYSPDDVARVIDRITMDYQRLDPEGSAYFAAQHLALTSRGLADYHEEITAIRSRYAGVPVGASESIFVPLANALGLRVLTPTSFLDAISEGAEPTAGDKTTIDAQMHSRQIRVYVFNRQNATPDVIAQVHEAQVAGIPTTTITETLTPSTATFQDWQTTQLRSLQSALAEALGR